jgi:hypothetical protein
MLLEKGQMAAILPCAGITLIRFTGLISDYSANRRDKHPGNAENFKAFNNRK